MPHSGQLRMLTAAILNLARGVPLLFPVFNALRIIDSYQGLISPHNPFAGAGGAHPPPNLATSQKEKR
jgi:hypothetical protein